jgi:hypothetical protein
MTATFLGKKINKIIKLIILQLNLQQTRIRHNLKQTFLSAPSGFIFTALP